MRYVRSKLVRLGGLTASLPTSRRNCHGSTGSRSLLLLKKTKARSRSAPGSSAAVKVDAVSRATTSSGLMSDAIVRGGRIVARSRGILGAPKTGTTLDVDRFMPADWTQLE